MSWEGATALPDRAVILLWHEHLPICIRAFSGRGIHVLISRSADGEWAAVYAIIDDILEKRRSIWLERLILCAMWLKSSRKAPLPWHQMLHLAEAVADKRIPLAEIPLMETIAVQSLGACLARAEEESR